MSSKWVHTWKREGKQFIVPSERISVGKLAIKFAIPNCPNKCAIANQCHLDGRINVKMGFSKDSKLAFTVITKEGRERWIFPDLPFSAVKQTYDVDAGKVIKPFRFNTGVGVGYRMVPWKRERYAGGKRRGPRSTPRIDKGSSRTLRREQMQALLAR